MTLSVLQGDALEVLRALPSDTFQTCVTSPPYYGLRSYLPADHPDKALEIGQEETPDAFVARLVEVFREVRRCLRQDGTLWINIGDSYASNPGEGRRIANVAGQPGLVVERDGYPRRNRGERKRSARHGDAKPKDLLMIPAMLALALRADGQTDPREFGRISRLLAAIGESYASRDEMPAPLQREVDVLEREREAAGKGGWWLRSKITWVKPNAMPESVEDRPTSCTEEIFLLSRSPRYFYDAAAIAEPLACPDAADGTRIFGGKQGARNSKHGERTNGRAYTNVPSAGRNARNAWSICTVPNGLAHFALMPPEIVERCIKAGSSQVGQCPECGTPWRRMAESREAEDTGAAIGGDPARQDGGTRERDPGGAGGNRLAVRRVGTDRFEPRCSCPAHRPVPQQVLDPFLGAGTTALVADRLGRQCTGIDLHGDYIAMARRRLVADAPLLTEVA